MLLAVALGIGAAAAATNYYVDATNGSDARGGTSPANAWRTLSRINSAPLDPGDAVFLKRGETWRERLLITRSGNASASIVFGAYDSGPNPVINGANPVTGWTAQGGNRYAASLTTAPEVVIFDGVRGIRESQVDRVDAALEWYWAGNVLTVYSESPPVNVEASARQFPVEFVQNEYVTFRDITIRYAADCIRLYNANHILIEGITVHDCAGYAGILVAADTTGRGEHNTARACTIYGMTGSAESMSHGGFGHGLFVWGLNACRANVFEGNILHDNGGGGVLLIDTSDNLVSGNTVYRHGSAGVVISGLNANGNVIDGNHLYENCRAENDCFGVNIYRCGHNNIVRNNRVHHQYVFTDEEVGDSLFTERSGGIRFDGDLYVGVTDKTGNAVYNNAIYGEYDGIQIFNFSNVAIHNNTIHDSGRSGIYIGSYAAFGTTRNTVCRNNVVQASRQQLVWHRNATDSTVDYNVYFPDGPAAFKWNSTQYAFDGWRSVSGFDGHSQVADPLFENAAEADFRLRVGSPCIDTGTSMGAPAFDFNRVPRPQGAGFDVGAYEHTRPPTASFTAMPRSGLAPLSVLFTDESDPGTSPITAWAWDFNNDGVVDSGAQMPVFTYLTPGKYSVALTITTALGQDTRVEADYINVTSGPTADFTAAPTIGLAPLEVAFTDASLPGNAPIVAWLWDFNNDGEPDSTLQQPVFSFGEGVYTVRLTVTDANGMSDTRMRTDYIRADTAPTAAFIGTPLAGFAPLTVDFTDLSLAGSRPIGQWSWDFGDGNGSVAQDPKHVYTTAGVFTVTLTVTTAAASDTHTEIDYVVVEEPVGPTAAFSGAPTSGLRPLAVQFADASLAGTYPITSWLWDFGDGATGAEQHPEHVYAHSGVYDVSLTVTTAAGVDVEIKHGYIDVIAGGEPIAAFSADPTAGRLPLEVRFADASTPGDAAITEWQWDFGDGGISADQNPLHTYSAPGVYDVSLTVTTAFGADTATAEGLIRVFTIVFVDQGNVSGAENGTTWAQAFRRIQDGVDMAAQLGGGDVWVAAGVYNEVRPDATGALVLHDGVSVYGGFTGVETDVIQRDWTANPTRIDGGMARGGAPAHHVVVGNGNARLDGFTVQGGRADSSAASRDRGAGVFVQHAAPTIANCVIRDNIAQYGGGGMYNGDAAMTRVFNCIFLDNATTGSFLTQGLGGAVYNTSGASPRFENCVFQGNAARATLFQDGLGGAMYSLSCAPLLVNCTFSENRTHGAFLSNGDGGALYNRHASPIVSNCIFWDDFPNEIVNSGVGAADVTYSDVAGGYPGAGNIAAAPLFANPQQRDLSLRFDSPCIDTGTLAGAPAADILGVPRPQGDGVDMGAYEHGALPVAAFSASTTRGLAPLAVDFTDLSQGGSAPIEEWHWDFGDGTFSDEQHPRHIYAIPGNYEARLTVMTAIASDATDPLVIVVGTPVTFTGQPEDQFAYAGDGIRFEVVATGGLGTLEYQWWFDDGVKAGVRTGVDSAVLQFARVSLEDAGLYWCEITDNFGVYTSNPATLAVAEPLQIIEQPGGGEKTSGATHMFQVTATGGFPPLEFVWKRDGTLLQDAQGDTLLIEFVSPQDAGVYEVEVYDAHTAMVVSDAAVLVVTSDVPVAGTVGLLMLAASAATWAVTGLRRRGRPLHR
ncbi:MAG TPA: PKD domain-containing protein [Candidatus Hydrogenedentes bacterium]|nr:PKD domain-containing protein [Candidatus Hydrogenedentota bacterium]